MSDQKIKICPHCKEDIKIRNPSEYYDFEYPEYCEICKKREEKQPLQIRMEQLEKELKQTKKVLKNLDKKYSNK